MLEDLFAGGRLMNETSDELDPYHKWLGIPKHQQPPTFYRLLGIELFESNAEVIDAAATRQTAYLHQLTSGPHRRLTQRLMNEIARARRVLLDPESRKSYDLKLKQTLSDTVAAEPSPVSAAATSDAPIADNVLPMFNVETTPRQPAYPFSIDPTKSESSTEPKTTASDRKRSSDKATSTGKNGTAVKKPTSFWQRNDWRMHLTISAVSVALFVVYLMFWGPGSRRQSRPPAMPASGSFDQQFKD
ncbi:MAG: hypothetical protein R3C05_15590 [Pirellulaceae bacterium]